MNIVFGYFVFKYCWISSINKGALRVFAASEVVFRVLIQHWIRNYLLPFCLQQQQVLTLKHYSIWLPTGKGYNIHLAANEWMIKILKAFNKIETQSRAVLWCKVTEEVHWVRERVWDIAFFCCCWKKRAVLLLLSSQDSSEGKTIDEWWYVKNSTKPNKRIGSTPVIWQGKKKSLLYKDVHTVSILTIS